MKHWIVSAVLMAAAVTAQAQPYLSGSIGVTSAHDDCEGASRCDKTDVGFKLLGGYKVTSNVGVEVGYYNLGKISATLPVGTANVGASIKTAGFGVGVAMFGNVAPEVEVFGRLALASLKTKISASYAGSTASESDSNVGLLLGLGASYALTKKLSIDASLDFGKHKYSDESSNVTMFGIGVTAKF